MPLLFRRKFCGFQPFQPSNTVSSSDQEQRKSTKNAQENANKWHFQATLAGFFENDTFFKKTFVKIENLNEFYYFQ